MPTSKNQNMEERDPKAYVIWKDYVDAHFMFLDDSLTRRFGDSEKAVRAALEAAEKAITKAEIENQRWREAANEWRGAMSDRERDFLTRKEFYTMIGTAVSVIGLIVVLVATR